MILPLLLAVLAFLAAMPILAPLMRGLRPTADRKTFDQAVYRDQLTELDRDIARGLLTEQEAGASRLEIQRRLLASDRAPSVVVRSSSNPIFAAVLFLFVAGGGLAFYLYTGQPGLPDEPFAAREAAMEQADAQNPLRKSTDQLAEKLKQNPSDAATWVLYGRGLAMLRQWDKAKDAYDHAISLGDNDPEVASARAEMIVMQADGMVVPAAQREFDTVLKTDPHNLVARYYLAIASLQAGEAAKAVGGLQTVLADMPQDSPMRPTVDAMIAQAARRANMPIPAAPPGADANSVAKAGEMSPAQREAMVRGMVANLAAKQQADPSNLDGWLRLGRAYGVLHERDKAVDAYQHAAALKPDDIGIITQLAQSLLSNQDPTARLTDQELTLLKRIEAADPTQPMALWYLGLNAAQSARTEDARQYWTALLKQIPAETQDATMVHQAIDALPKQQSGG